MPTKDVYDIDTGEVTEVEMTGAELAAYEAARAAEQDAATRQEQFRAALAAARPTNPLLVKIRDGTALTAAELQTVVRWLALRELREMF